MDKSELENDERVVAFVDAAKKYCALIDDRNKFDLREFVKKCGFHLAELYASAIRLHELQVEPIHIRGLPRMPFEDWQVLSTDLSKKFRNYDIYHFNFDPYEAGEVINGLLSYDTSDIYGDLKNGLLIFGSSDAETHAAIWEWIIYFQTHWGRHCANALVTIRAIMEVIEDAAMFDEEY